MTRDGSTILIIDDEEVMRSSCTEALSKVGHTVQVAENGKEGLQKIAELKPEVVLLDLKMPGVSGMEVLERTSGIDRRIVTIVITGYATVSSAVEAMKKGAYDFLPKPFTPDELRIIVERAVERRRLLGEAERLESERRKMKETFVSMVSHELRTPIATVLQYFEVLLGGVVGEIPSEQEKVLRRMQSRMRDLLSLIRDWLSLAEIEKGRLTERFGEVDIAPVLSETVEFLRPQAESRHLSIELQLEDALPTISADSRTLRLVFSNLISNAIKYNRDGGTITVTARKHGSKVDVVVADTGIGIAEEDLPFIFDDFYRVRAIETEGTGLGLSIAKRIIEAHGGTISATSKIGQGTTFVVSLWRSTE